MTPTELQAQNERVNRSIALQRLPKSRLVALLTETMKRGGYRLVAGSPRTWSKQELANEILLMESR